MNDLIWRKNVHHESNSKVLPFKEDARTPHMIFPSISSNTMLWFATEFLAAWKREIMLLYAVRVSLSRKSFSSDSRTSSPKDWGQCKWKQGRSSMVVVLLKKYHIRTHISLVPIASEEQPSTKVMKKKIHIGYILKSADIRTLVSRRNSENSSHTHAHTRSYHKHPHIPTHTRTHPCTPMHTRTHPCIPTNTQVHQGITRYTLIHPHTPAHSHSYPHKHLHTSMYTQAHLLTPEHTHAQLRTHMHTRAHPRTPVHTHAHPCTPHTYLLMPLT